MTRDQDDDLQTLRRMLPMPAERDFPTGRRHQREEHLMTSWLTMSRRNDKRRSPGVRIVLPAGLAAAAAGIALTALPAQTAAAYTLQNEKDDLVKLTIVNPAGKIDLGGLQKDLDRLGVHSRVLAGDPNCSTPWGNPDPSASPSPEPTPTSTPSSSANPFPGGISQHDLAVANGWGIGRENGKTVLYVNPRKIPADKQLMVGFPLAKTDPAHAYGVITAGLLDGTGPDCLPAPPPGAVQFR
ncbi:hypothetical protein [Streptomyces sp. NPDC057909]|uniref:hypothetical protein n=1 Tax=Streptomyces sp. NPDC057909 TaxID=3346277 RepID=UPI0036E3DA25